VFFINQLAMFSDVYGEKENVPVKPSTGSNEAHDPRIIFNPRGRSRNPSIRGAA
jgi:hypothetical protein